MNLTIMLLNEQWIMIFQINIQIFVFGGYVVLPHFREINFRLPVKLVLVYSDRPHVVKLFSNEYLHE